MSTIDKQQLSRTLQELDRSLRHLAAAGVDGFACSARTLEKIRHWGKPPAAELQGLEKIRADLGDCRRCKLAVTRKHIVFGEGSSHARLVFVGEGPGYEEDQRGKPFVGAAGQLLTRIIEAIKLTREQVYICNIIKCRPPGNRNPQPDEIQACFPFLKRQLEAIRPQFICALGKVAAQTLLGSQQSISALRGRFHDYQGMRVLPTYHPAYLLRNPAGKRDVWQDMQMLMGEYDYEG